MPRSATSPGGVVWEACFVRTPGEVLDTADLLRHRPWPSAGPGCPSGRPRWPLTPSFRPEVWRLYLADEPRLWWTHAFARRFMMARPRYALSDRRSRRLRGLLIAGVALVLAAGATVVAQTVRASSSCDPHRSMLEVVPTPDLAGSVTKIAQGVRDSE